MPERLAVAELKGRVTVVDGAGERFAMGTNENLAEIVTLSVPPQAWRLDTVTSPHGVAFDADGNILVTEWNEWGRVLKFIPIAP